jgi:hypothetical protein
VKPEGVSDCRFLAIKNWRKYQSTDEVAASTWIKDYVNKDIDPDFSRLTIFQQGMLDKLQRLRGKIGRHLPDDVQYLLRATLVHSQERKNAARAIALLLDSGFLIPTNQEDELLEERREEERRGEESKKESNRSRSSSRSSTRPQGFDVSESDL